MLRALAICPMLIVPTTALPKDFHALRGFGNVTCGEFARDYAKSPNIEVTFFAWAQGYLSGLNMMAIASDRQIRNLFATSPEAQMSLLRSYCDQHPLGTYLDAISALTDTLPLETYRYTPPNND